MPTRYAYPHARRSDRPRLYQYGVCLTARVSLVPHCTCCACLRYAFGSWLLVGEPEEPKGAPSMEEKSDVDMLVRTAQTALPCDRMRARA